MPRQGGQGKGKPRLKDRKYGFGTALLKSQQYGSQGLDGRVTKEITNMKSVLDASALDDYLLVAEMEGTAPEVKRVHQNDAMLIEPTQHRQPLQKFSGGEFDYKHLRIPRKPSWTRTMTADEVDRRETDNFLDWRREISQMEEKYPSMKVTPFEKNIEVWRQLWRVLERCDMAVQIVDARNPLMYYTEDLMKYASELEPPRPVMLLVNKADLLTEYQRRAWARHFESIGVRFAFYSAQIEQEKIDVAATRAIAAADRGSGTISGRKGILNESDDEEEEESRVEEKDDIEYLDADEVMMLVEDIAEGMLHLRTHLPVTAAIPPAAAAPVSVSVEETNTKSDFVWGGDNAPVSDTDADAAGTRTTTATAGFATLVQEDKLRRRARVLTRAELILLLSELPSRLHLQPQPRHQGRICVGMLGYPNVGKSSAINTILAVSKSSHGVTRVAVSSTPGKTKHFQTLMVSEALMLCDCPGLVFPSFMSSPGEMLCAGILPINQMRDYIEPAAAISSRVPMHLLEAAYGMKIRRLLDFKDAPDRPPTPHEMLEAYCALKGYITNGTGRWDEFRACKELLRDFNDGRILFVSPPTGPLDMVRWLSETEKVMIRREKVAERVASQRLKELTEADENEQRMKAAGIKLGGAAERGEMVFGNSAKGEEFQYYEDDSSDSSEDEDGEDDDESVSAATGTIGGGMRSSVAAGSVMGETAAAREHKRLKRWGKKNKKLRSKTPYADDNVGGTASFAVYSTNRSVRAGDGGPVERRSNGGDKVKRQDPRNTYGVEFARNTFNYQKQDPTLSSVPPLPPAVSTGG